MKVVIQPQGTLAIYEQIVNQLKNAIVTGELKTNEALPSIRALAGDLQVSVITTKRAYEELEKEGLIRSVAGKGFYVCEYNTDFLKEILSDSGVDTSFLKKTCVKNGHAIIQVGSKGENSIYSFFFLLAEFAKTILCIMHNQIPHL